MFFHSILVLEKIVNEKSIEM